MRYQFGDWIIEPQLNRVSRGDQSVRLERRNMDLLEHLLEHADEVVSRDQILEAIWQGRVVEPEAVARGINQIRHALGDDPRRPRYIETIHKRGYRTLANVQRLDSAAPADCGPDRHVVTGWWPSPSSVLSITAALFLLATLAWFFYRYSLQDGQTSGSGPQPSIAILPLRDLSQDVGYQRFADGLTAELILSLSRVEGLGVISATSSFSLRDDERSLKEIGETLGVEYILEGSVRRSNDSLRVTAQLVDAAKDKLVWSESYSRNLNAAATMDIQLEVARRVSASLSSDDPLAPSSSSPESLDALDSYYDGRYYLRRMETSHRELASADRAIELFEAAIREDPSWAPAHAALGAVHHFMANAGNTDARLTAARKHVEDAINLDPRYGPAYESLGYILTFRGDYSRAMEAFDQARALGYDAHWGRAVLLMVLAKFREAAEEYRSRLVSDPLSIPVRWQLAQAEYCVGNYDRVIAESSKLLAADPDDLYSRIRLANSHARKGRHQKAASIADPVLQSRENPAPLALYFALTGQVPQALRAIEHSRDSTPRITIESAVPAAVIVGDRARAATLLGQASSQIDPGTAEGFNYLFHFRCSPEVRSLADEPQYQDALEHLGLHD